MVELLTYGFRGVVHVTIDILSTSPDLHSGVEGNSVTKLVFPRLGLEADL